MWGVLQGEILLPPPPPGMPRWEGESILMPFGGRSSSPPPCFIHPSPLKWYFVGGGGGVQKIWLPCLRCSVFESWQNNRDENRVRAFRVCFGHVAGLRQWIAPDNRPASFPHFFLFAKFGFLASAPPLPSRKGEGRGGVEKRDSERIC